MTKIEVEAQSTKGRGGTWEIGEERLLRKNIEPEYILVFGRQNRFLDEKKRGR